VARGLSHWGSRGPAPEPASDAAQEAALALAVLLARSCGGSDERSAAWAGCRLPTSARTDAQSDGGGGWVS
jgi:hypothetical protein